MQTSTPATKQAARDSIIDLEYWAERKPGRGWTPAMSNNGRMALLGWDTCLSREQAEVNAHAECIDTAARYIGDWIVTISKRAEGR